MIGLMFLFAVVSQVYAKFDPIAFTVYQASGNFPGNATITYPHNITIHSSATNVLNGIFTSTRDGIYKFSVFGCSRTDGHFILDLIKNTTSLATLYGHVNSGHAVAANSVIVHLKVGDTVKVKSKDASPVSLYSSDFKENTFTGVQLGSQSLYSREHAAVIAFSVTANHHQNVIGDAIVQYHTKLVDDAGDLDLTSGIYMARSSGYYVLYFSRAQYHRIGVKAQGLLQNHMILFFLHLIGEEDEESVGSLNPVQDQVMNLVEGDPGESGGKPRQRRLSLCQQTMLPGCS
ncbi:hypothetical protein DPMN_034772 [Dreissena polymorpha]|uniref:C1q domain-containing protein n=1 Tax=Dreissena polymorpha TaxID=45954 RepID=A0A9D4M631_DREPO|nr:hypothetical protein DPMN_034772 [Dreissena polymorpha]